MLQRKVTFAPVWKARIVRSWNFISSRWWISGLGTPDRILRKPILWTRRLGACHILRFEHGRDLCLVGLTSLAVLSVGIAHASGRIESRRALHDVSSDTDPNSTFWRGIPAIVVDRDANGEKVSGSRMEVRSRWTPEHLYFLFICSYGQLHLKPDPQLNAETNDLWHWDVAETFIGSNFRDIRKYREFEVSPQAEWVDLDIDLDRLRNSHDWTWNSGFKVSARIDPAAHKWYGFMAIPYSSVDSRPASAGNRLRINFYLSEGAGSGHRAMAWQPTHQGTFHVPKVFGIIELRPIHR